MARNFSTDNVRGVRDKYHVWLKRNLAECRLNMHYLYMGLPLGKPSYKKNGKKADNVCFGRPTPPKGVKSEHLLSEKNA